VIAAQKKFRFSKHRNRRGPGGGASGKKNIDTGSYTADVNIGLGGGLNYSVSMTETEQMLQDMNGDGLPDKVIKLPPVIDMIGTVTESGALRVYYNTGNGFASEAVEFDTPDWAIGEDEINHFKTRTDGNLLTALFSQLPLVGNKLSTVFDGQFGNGYALNPLGADIQKYLNRLELTSSISAGLSISANAGGNVSIILTAVKLNFTLGGGGGFNTGASVSGVSMRLQDLNGDGLPDRVLRIPGSDKLWVQLNRTGRVGQLKTIVLPQGGEYRLEYEWEPGTTRMPQSRYVLSAVTQTDNSGSNGLQNPAYAGEHAYTVRYEYFDGYYDRSEKEFYGFRLVTAAPVDEQGTALSTTVTEYYTDSYYRKGMTRHARTEDRNGTVLRVSEFETDAAPYVRNVREHRRVFEAGSSGEVVSETRYEYDNYGNVTRLEEEASGAEPLTAEITYWHNDSRYFHAHPQTIRVWDSGGLLRIRRGVYDTATGALISLTQQQGETANPAVDSTTAIEWDAYGNLSKITDPNGAYVSYEYSDRYHRQYVERIYAGGPGIPPYRSEMEWDAKFGLKTQEVDENRQVINYQYDDYGRLSAVWSPYDKYGQGGAVAAVQYEYHTKEGANWYAVTKNKVYFDSTKPDTLTTVILTDGLGRALYTAKQGAVWKNNAVLVPLYFLKVYIMMLSQSLSWSV
jgi:YD repeat-containing protein